ncbi:MAG: HPr family phosphocarrier protein [Deltaproteobacteria bacterium]|nr:HPr family phosphocarrier protein [Deltaproteobacteria bacterium]
MAELTRDLVIQNELGLHARAAALLVGLVARHKPDFWLRKEDMEINGKSIMGVLMLAAAKGTTLTARVVGPEEQGLKDMLDQVEELVNNKFGEGR